MKKDYYQTLGIAKSASEAEIKSAYRKLAHKYHPDKAGGDESKFKEISEAYQVLSNKEKRSQYDRFGQVFEGGPSAGGAGFGGFGFDPANVRWDVNFSDLGDLGDVFEGIFGGGRRQTYAAGADIELAAEISLEDAFRGVRRSATLNTLIVCAACAGLGHDAKKGSAACAACHGKGEVRIERKTFFGNFSQLKTCDKCEGRGEVPNAVCAHCKGKGRVRGAKIVDVAISPGIEDGQIIKIAGVGEAGERNGPSGDAYVVVHIKSHPVFSRKKQDLFTEQPVSVADLLLGRPIEITDIAGDKLIAAVPPGFNLKEKIKVPGRGMTRLGSRSGDRGDLYISLDLKTPAKLSKKAKELIEELGKELGS